MPRARLMEIVDEAKRQRLINAQRARVMRIVDRWVARPEAVGLHPREAAILYLHEAIHSNRHKDAPDALKMGRLILAASESVRRAILLAILKALAHAPLDACTWQVNVLGDLRLVHDFHWNPLIKSLLRSRAVADVNWLVAVLDGLSGVAYRFNSKYPVNSYDFPFSTLVRYVVKHANSVPHNRLTPAANAFMESLKREVAHDLVKLKGYKNAEARLLAQQPERWFVKRDRGAIEALQEWLSAATQQPDAGDVPTSSAE